VRATSPPSSGHRKRVVLLGATGSIGETTLRVIARHSDRLELVGVAARGNWRRLAEIAATHKVRHVGLHDLDAASEAAAAGVLPSGVRLYAGLEGLTALATLPEADVVLVAVVGTTGLEPALAALAAGKNLALASKEILVLAGPFVMEALARSKARLLPIDSEHAAIAQCLEGRAPGDVSRILLTASGGAFRDRSPEDLHRVTPEEALRHPNWSMGPKITVDSATLANKGLELIEARWLFDLRPDQCHAILHPQSIVHGLVEFVDGTLVAQLSPPSMAFPIQRALLGERLAPPLDPRLSLAQRLALDFRPIDEARYPLFRLARHSLEAGGLAPAIYNAANEVAVAAFLAHQLPFLAISEVVEHSLRVIDNHPPQSLAEVLTADAVARRIAGEACTRLAAGR
jgi:1-deoxy-D-xylulose-5-phosphate reductoisomerase